MNTSTASTNLVNEALKLASLGFRVLPTTPFDKGTLLKRWPEKSSSDEEAVSKLWEGRPNHNIGIHAHDLLIVDIDSIKEKTTDKDGKEIVVRTKNTWPHEFRLLELNPPSAQTPNGGKHYFFKLPPGVHVGCHTNTPAPGVDIKSGDGYVLAAPSVIRDAATGELGRYLWINHPDSFEFPVAPQWLIDLILSSHRKTNGPKNSPKSDPHGFQQVPELVESGGRNDLLYRFGCAVRRSGPSENVIYATLSEYNHEHCKPPLEDHEVRSIARQCAKHEPEQAEEIMILGLPRFPDSDENDDETTDVRLSDPGPLPHRLLSVPGLISEIVEFNRLTAPCEQPALALGAALTLLAAMTSGKIADESDMRPNLYVVGVAPSGSGKDHPRKINKEILKAANWSSLLGPEDAASGAGIITNIAKKRCSIWHMDEIGKSIKIVNGKNAQSYQSNIIPVLLKLYTSSGSTYLSPAYADEKRVSIEINEPHLNIYGSAVDEQILDALSTESISDGLLARLLIFEGDSVDQEEKLKLPVPAGIVGEVEYWRDFIPGGNVGTKPFVMPVVPIAKPYVVRYDAAGKAVLDMCRTWINQEKKKKGPAWQLLTRVVEKAKKLAMLYACSKDRFNPVMDEEAVRWACEVSLHLTQRLRYLASTRLADSQGEQEIQWVQRLIDEKFSGEITESDFNRSLKKKFMKRWNEVKMFSIELLGLVSEETKTAGRPRTVWRSRKKRPKNS